MPNQNKNRSTFWRAKIAREYAKKFQEDQLRAYIPIDTGPGKHHGIPSDRPPLHPILSPAPILVDPDLKSAPEPKAPGDLLVGIVGAGAAGLYTAMILDSLGIPYEILESSNRVGGRILTHHFQQSSNEWNYYDIGAMRYPKIPVMYRVFDLFINRLGIENKLVPYIMSDEAGNQILEYNAVRKLQKEIPADTPGPKPDSFNDSTTNQGLVPPDFVSQGVGHWLAECFDPFRNLFVKNWDEGWAKLMEYDAYSCRSFMAAEFKVEEEEFVLQKDRYPNSAIDWMERMNTGTGLFDMAFSEMVIDDLQFDYPNATAIKYGADPPDEGADWEWFCLAGGSEVFIKAMLAKISTKPKVSKRVVSVVPTAANRPLTVTYTTNQVNASPETSEYDYVISTIPLASLRFVNLDRCNLSYAQREGMRTLRYDASCKVGLKFRTRWWQTLGSGPIVGGQTKTDRVVRTVVYPSYGVEDPNADAVMIASYTWSQDALRVGGLINGYQTADEKFLINNIIEDLAVLHQVEPSFLHEQLEDYSAFDWYSDSNSLGAFALFGPGQFSNIYTAWGQPAAGGRLLFAGEALSEQHAWVEGALDSAYWSVHKLLTGAGKGFEGLLAQLETKWGNENLPADEAKEHAKMMRTQEFLGAIFSTFSDADKLEVELKKLTKKENISVFLDPQAA